MNCCAPTGQCDDSHNCPAHATQPIKASRCNELGICQGLGADQCPDCDSFECEVPCADAPAPTRPLAGVRHPFAPGVIEGPATRQMAFDADDGLPLTARENAVALALVLGGCAALGFLLGFVVEKLA